MMESLKRFTDATIKHLEEHADRPYYVYCLRDPRNGEIFYVGKGKRNRVFNHKEDAQKELKKDLFEKEKKKNLKLDRIKDIINENLEVEGFIVSYDLDESQAYAAENALINLINLDENLQLTNIVSGHGSKSFKVEDFEARYGYEPIKVEDINTDELILAVKVINAFDLDKNEDIRYPKDIYARDENNLKLRTLGIWPIGVDIVDKIKYIIGVNTGADNAVVSAYEVSTDDVLSDTKKTKNGSRQTKYAFNSTSNSEALLKELNLYKKSLPSVKIGQLSRAYINRK